MLSVTNGPASSSITPENVQDLYHQRLYTLDRQVDHAQAEILNNLGLWLMRRSRHTEQKLEDANSILQHCEYSKEYLQEQWKLQIQAQTKPLP
ncbi:hypothetical protein H0H92_001570, partial [Tricholoma furcatifolium]